MKTKTALTPELRHGLGQLLAKSREAKDALLEATDLAKELDDLLAGFGAVAGRPDSLLRSAGKTLRRADELSLEALDLHMHVLTCIEQTLVDAPTLLLVCGSCGSSVRITERLAKEVARPQCVACAGELRSVS